ncbi:MAG: prepilin-type N-terminal cleavage/methylation domain-containing protein, partial [Phycisphaerae bacterium]|nr:prepilin-type N-terminal cleavage/methylation domain-containing protein [Phycisphaerae bacterium]
MNRQRAQLKKKGSGTFFLNHFAPKQGQKKNRIKKKRFLTPFPGAAFTLIELLVVIAILSLLVSILLPSLQKAKLLARRVLCLTRLKSIGSVYYLYVNDFNGRGPMGFAGNYPIDYFIEGPPGKGYPYSYWFGWYSHEGLELDESGNPTTNLCWALGKYLGVGDTKEKKLPVFCPSDISMENLSLYNNGTSYTVNAYLGTGVYLGDHVTALASTPMLMDGNYWDVSGNNSFWYTAFPNGLGVSWYNNEEFFIAQASDSHEGTGNFLFFDGHTENQEELEDMDAYRYDIGWTWYGNNQQR